MYNKGNRCDHFRLFVLRYKNNWKWWSDREEWWPFHSDKKGQKEALGTPSLSCYCSCVRGSGCKDKDPCGAGIMGGGMG